MPGAMLGGLIIGLIEAFWAAYLSPEYKDVATFSILILVLMFPSRRLARPSRGGESMRQPVQVHRAPTFAARAKDALAVAFMALLLGIPMIGLTTVDQGGALQVATRWPLLAGFVLAVFAGRFACAF